MNTVFCDESVWTVWGRNWCYGLLQHILLDRRVEQLRANAQESNYIDIALIRENGQLAIDMNCRRGSALMRPTS